MSKLYFEEDKELIVPDSDDLEQLLLEIGLENIPESQSDYD